MYGCDVKQRGKVQERIVLQGTVYYNKKSHILGIEHAVHYPECRMLSGIPCGKKDVNLQLIAKYAI